MKPTTGQTAFAWTVDDVGSGDPRWIEDTQCVLDALRDDGVFATLFVVPRPGGKPVADDWRTFIMGALSDGHDVQLHGLTHENCWEFGPPNWPATSILPSLADEFRKVEAEWRPRHSEEALLARIREGAEALRSEFDVTPAVFRAPCGAICKAMFSALAAAGIRFHSCEYISATGYNHLPHRQRTPEHEWSERIPHDPFRWYGGVVEVPILNEWTWQGAWRHEDAMRSVMEQDVARACRECAVAVPLMHTHGIGSDRDYAARVTREAVALAERLGARFGTLAELVADGTLDGAAVAQGPDTLEY